MPDGSATAHSYRPKLFTSLADGYGLTSLRKDAFAGLTVAIVALPLSLAIGVASGVPPERGLYAAIIGGFVVSALGGSRFQVGGPAGAFIVLVSSTVAQHGIEGLLIAVLLSGLFLALLGLSGLGALIRHIPHAVTIGFTCGIAVTIFASQLRDLAGLAIAGTEPGHLIPKFIAIGNALPSANLDALAVGLATIAMIIGLRRWRPEWPGMLIAIIIAALVTVLGHLPVDTIGSRFGGLPSGLPLPQLPSLSWSRIWEILPAAFSFTVLSGVESLLSAKIADGMTGRKHRYNMELLAQGIANVASALFGGISVTGTIARTATNIRAGAQSPVAGILHSVFLLGFLLIAAPLAYFIPLSALAGLLVIVCWNMVESREFADAMGAWPSAVVLLMTLGLTLVFDLTVGIAAGCLTAAAITIVERRINSPSR
ncbi:MAG: SulP family inorganic anion transporter [Hyphomicrobium sp.]